MSNALSRIEQAGTAIEEATAKREAAIAMAFSTLQEHKPLLAQMLIENHGDHRKAARWMCLHQRAFGGKSAYEVLVEGDEDRIWDEMDGPGDHESRLLALVQGQ